MNQQLVYLMNEVCAAVEIYYTGRTGTQYLKTAFILCDNCSELVSKLFLLTDDPDWSDQKPNNRYKNYTDVMNDVKAAFAAINSTDVTHLIQLQTAMMHRHRRRNDFFHSTNLLDLSVTTRTCVEAFCDLLDYGSLLFGTSWWEAMEASRDLATYEILLKLDKRSFSDPSITPRLNRILENRLRNSSTAKKRGVHVTQYPEDLHLRLSVVFGGTDLRDKLKALLLS